MAELKASVGDRVRFLDIQANHEKGLVGATGTVKKEQDWVLHVEMDNPELSYSSVRPGNQYPTRRQVEVINSDR